MHVDRKLAALGLKYNPFTPDAPTSAMYPFPAVESFCFRVETLAKSHGGFALKFGKPGSGKSSGLRQLCARLSQIPDVVVNTITRPQASVHDFYREIGDCFGVPLTPHNRWNGTKSLRQKWLAHIDASLYRPVLIIDEAQEMSTKLLNELRLLASVDLDARCILTIVLAADEHFPSRLKLADLLPLDSRIRVRLPYLSQSPDVLAQVLRHALAEAGNPVLFTDSLIDALADHAAGNLRILMSMAADLLCAALLRDIDRIDDSLFFELFAPKPPAPRNGKRR